LEFNSDDFDRLERSETVKISTRGEYGLRAMLDLAEHYHQHPISLRSIAERQGISESYLEQLIAGLKKAGLVNSIRGAQGGYQLAKDPAMIRISEIFIILEGPIAPTECVNEDYNPEAGCKNSQTCAVRLLWQKLRNSITEVLESTTLADLVTQSKALNQEQLIYYI
jgi:Rrf2 family cysteine metabolism transcriptional repressor